MVKGISRQVIVVHSPDPKLFEQAIFILRENAVEQGVTEELLLKEAKLAVREGRYKPRRRLYGPMWALFGALATGAVWGLTLLL